MYLFKFQGFNWESWRRRWYLELAAKASDLSQSGITAVWLPPPTESVAPQGLLHLIFLLYYLRQIKFKLALIGTYGSYIFKSFFPIWLTWDSLMLGPQLTKCVIFCRLYAI